ncbi:MAG: ABC transporter substrate-binding protein, partial [Alkalispirochaetaceae bacterium]
MSVTLYAGGGQEADDAAADSGKKWAGESITVHFMDASYGDFAEVIAERFEEEYGGTVEVVKAPFSALHERYGLALRTGDSTYDVFSVASQWDGEFARWMTDLDPYIEDSPDFDSEDILDKAWDQSGKFGGKTMGIPHAYTPRLISYRTDLVDGVPETWDEFFELAESVHDPDNDFYAFAPAGNKIQLASIFNVSLWSMDGRWADEDWNITIDSPEAREALDIAKRVIELSDPAALSWGLPEADAAFLAGNAAFNFAWPTLGVTVDGDNPDRSDIVGDWALDLYPEEDTATTVLSAWDIGIP